MALEKGAFSQHSKGFWALLLHNKKEQWHTQDSAQVGQQFPHRFMWKLYRLRENMLEGSHACLQVEYRVFHSQKKYSSNLLLQVLLNVIHHEEEQYSCTNTTWNSNLKEPIVSKIYVTIHTEKAFSITKIRTILHNCIFQTCISECRKKAFYQIQIWKLPNMHWEAKFTLWGAQMLTQIYMTHARQNSRLEVRASSPNPSPKPRFWGGS